MFVENKILTHYEKAKQILNGEMPTPRMALFYPSYACNHNCPGCHYKDWNKNSKDKLIDIEDFKNWVKQLKDLGLEAIEFCGGGEPTVHPRFSELLEIVQSHGLKFGMFTNGSKLDIFSDQLANMATYVRVSIDDEIEYDKLKVLCDKRDETSSKMKVGAKILLNSDNFKLLEEKIKKCNECKVDYVQVKTEKPTIIPLTPKQKEEFLKLKSKYPTLLGSVENTSLECKCWLTPIHTMIDTKGDVFLCCYYQFREDAHKIGNLKDSSFKDIWFSEKHQEKINNIETKECNVFDCRWHTYNKKLLSMMENSHLEFC